MTQLPKNQELYMSRLTSPHAQLVYEATAQFVERGLRQDDSIFTPGNAIWTAENAESLHDYFVGNPIVGTDLNFTEKLARQLSDAPDPTIQLMAELNRTGIVGDSKT